MAQDNDAMADVPDIKKVQYNVAGTEHAFEGVERVDQEYSDNINHDDWAARIVLENENWIEYRKLNESTMEECAFVQEQHPTGQHEAFLHDSVEIGALDFEHPVDLWNAVDESIQVYQDEVESVDDAQQMWDTIVPVINDK